MKRRYRPVAAWLAAALLLVPGCAKAVRVPVPPEIAQERIWESPINWRFSIGLLPPVTPPPPPSLLAIARNHLQWGDHQAAIEIYQVFIATTPPGPERDHAQFHLAILQGLDQDYAAAQQSLKELYASRSESIRGAAEWLDHLIEERNFLERQQQEQQELVSKLDRQVRTLKRTVNEKKRTIEERERELEEKERTLQESIEKLKRLILETPP